LVHPQQPLSYLERLIQAELPTIVDKKGNEHIPAVNFRAKDRIEDSLKPKKSTLKDDHYESTSSLYDQNEEEKPPNPHPSGRSPTFVRWSKSVELGDFIRDAASGHEFAVEIEGAPEPIMVGVPSFADRTYYLRMRLRSTSRKIADMADIKRECDELAHRGGQRVALAGFGALCGWWYLVYRLTFETDLGWDVMEPVTVCPPCFAWHFTVSTLLTRTSISWVCPP
jgi:calcium uniporter protein, mitochondrial